MDRRHLLPAALVAAAVAFPLVTQRTSAVRAQTISNLGLMAIAGVAAWACWQAANADPGMRRTWRFLALSCGSWALGQAAWTVLESVLHLDPFPSIADVGYLPAIPLAIAALLTLPSAPKRLTSRARLVLDGMTICGTLFLLSWPLAIAPLVRAEGPLVPKLIGVAYPSGDVVTVTVLLLAVAQAWRRRDPNLPTFLVLALGLFGISAADSAFAATSGSGSYASGHIIDAGWFAGYALVAVAALRHPGTHLHVSGRRKWPTRAGLLLPYAPVLIAVSFSLVLDFARGIDTGLVVGRNFLFAVLLIRQGLTLLENHSLSRHLEHRVRLRTDELRRSEERFRSLVQNGSDVVAIVSADGTFSYVTPSVGHVFGYAHQALIGANVLTLVDAPDRERLEQLLADIAPNASEATIIELGIRHAAGFVCQTETVVTNRLDDPAVAGIVLNTRDVSERKALEAELTYQAHHDPLTGLPNRTLFKDRLSRALAERRDPERLAVLFIDLDGFKAVNDTVGHAAGDTLLITVAHRLMAAVRAGDTVARLGGDEFGILLADIAGEEEAIAVTERVLEVLSEEVYLEAREFSTAASIGLALTQRGDESSDEILRNADHAMYRAKAAGLGRYERYDPLMHADVLDRRRLSNDLRRAVRNEELALEYQPIVDLDSGRVEGVEALLRWHHPQRGLVPPNTFIPIAEQSELICELGEWVLRTACTDIADLRRAGADLTLNVNISARQFQGCSSVVDVVQDALRQSGLPASALVLELTENVLIDHGEETIHALAQLRSRGVRVALDDFGTGYSSLSYLHRFPADAVKIDRSFVSGLDSQPASEALAASIVRIGNGMHLETVAEGIESLRQMDKLRRLGCRKGQGFLFYRPLPRDVLERTVLAPTEAGVARALAPAGVPAIA